MLGMASVASSKASRNWNPSGIRTCTRAIFDRVDAAWTRCSAKQRPIILPRFTVPFDDVRVHLRLSESEVEQQPNQTNQYQNGGPTNGKTDQICSVRAPQTSSGEATPQMKKVYQNELAVGLDAARAIRVRR